MTLRRRRGRRRPKMQALAVCVPTPATPLHPIPPTPRKLCLASTQKLTIPVAGHLSSFNRSSLVCFSPRRRNGRRLQGRDGGPRIFLPHLVAAMVWFLALSTCCVVYWFLALLVAERRELYRVLCRKILRRLTL